MSEFRELITTMKKQQKFDQEFILRLLTTNQIPDEELSQEKDQQQKCIKELEDKIEDLTTKIIQLESKVEHRSQIVVCQQDNVNQIRYELERLSDRIAHHEHDHGYNFFSYCPDREYQV